MRTKEEIINYLKTREELLPIVSILDDAAKVRAEKNKVIASNNEEKDKLIKERNKLESKMLSAKELFNFLEVANLEDEIKKVDLKLASINAQLEHLNNTAAISEETAKNLYKEIRGAYKEFMKHEASEVLELLEPLEEFNEENLVLIDFVNNAFRVVQYELFKDKRYGYFDTMQLWEGETEIIRAIERIVDKDRGGYLEKFREGRSL